MYDRNIKILIYYTKTRCLWGGGGGGVRTRGVVAVHELLVNPVGYQRYNIRSSPALFCQPGLLLLSLFLNHSKRISKRLCPCLRRRSVSRWELIDIERALEIRCTLVKTFTNFHGIYLPKKDLLKILPTFSTLLALHIKYYI